jgi:Na+/H+ antiporter NhaC
MFWITTLMFVLGLIALVLETALGFQQMQLFLDPTSGGIWSSMDTNIIIAVGATITRIMVRLGTAPPLVYCVNRKLNSIY